MKSMVKKLKQNLRSDKEKEKERWFLDNGSMFLKALITDCNGKAIPIRRFSSDQIYEATNNFDSSCLVTNGGFFFWYKGIIEDRSYMIKKFTEDWIEGEEEVYKDIVLSARMSNHNNFLKLLGCCLELPIPVLVFEYAEYGALNKQGRILVNGEESILPLNIRLNIVKEIANALTYLHMAFPNIIIHRDVCPEHIFLDENWTAKLSDLYFSILIDEGKSQVEADVVRGTYGYLDPLYFKTGIVSEYTDVYSFGVFLLVVITGKPVIFTESDGESQNIVFYVKGLYENGKVDEVMDPKIVKDKNRSDPRLLLEACIVLALRCCEMKDEDRPKMMEIAKQLKRIERSFRDLTCSDGALHLVRRTSNQVRIPNVRTASFFLM